MEGWIKLFRQLKDWEWYSDTVTFRVFIHLLISANYEEKKWKGITIGRGQVFTSYQHIIDEIGDESFSKQNIRTAINHLKSTGELTVLSTRNGLLINIEKYSLYQSQKEKLTDQSTDLLAPSQQTANTNIRNIRNKEEKENINKIKLNNLYMYIRYKAEKFENLTDADRTIIVRDLKRLDMYVENDAILLEDKIFELQLKYYAFTELYKSSYRVYINDLDEKLFTLKFLDAQKYCPISVDEDIPKFMGYLIVCLRKELKKE